MRTSGRKPRDPRAKPTKVVPVRLTEDEKAAYEKAARESGLTLSEWMRGTLDAAVEKSHSISNQRSEKHGRTSTRSQKT